MMKKLLVITSFVLFLISATNIQACLPIGMASVLDELPGPEVMPDSPFYFLKIWYEKIVLFFTFSTTKKAEKYKIFAEKRIYEIKKMTDKGRQDLAEKVKEVYKSYLNKAQEKLEKAIRKALEQKKEELMRELEKKIEEIKIKIKETINL